MGLDKEYDNYCTIEDKTTWIQGYPLKTQYGIIKPINISEYNKYSMEIGFLKLQSWELEKLLIEEYKSDEVKVEMLKSDFKNNEFITNLKNNVCGIRIEYAKVLSIFIDGFDEKMFYKMNNLEFDNLRKLILEFNDIFLYEANPNPEIERYNRMKSYMAFKKGKLLVFDTIFTTLMSGIGGGHSVDDINNMTIRQFHSLYKRVEFIKAYDTTTLYKTVDSKGDIEVISWDSPIDVEDKSETEYKDISQLKQHGQSVLL